jgi:hypothetical protein
MLWAYFDETIVNVVDAGGGKLRPKEMFVGGCVADGQQWEEFKVDWRGALADEGVKAFHARDFYAFKGDFNWLTTNGEHDLVRHGNFRDKLADIILEYTEELLVFTSMAPIRERGTRKAYEDAVMRALFDFTKNKRGVPDSVYVVLARHPEISPWSILRKFEQIDWEGKLAGCGLFLPADVAPLQAADFVLHSANKRWGGLEVASFRRLAEGCAKRKKSFRQMIASTSHEVERLLAPRSNK